MHKCLISSEAQIVLKELHGKNGWKTFCCRYYCKKNNLMQDIGGQLYSRILMTFAKVVTTVKKLDDLKQKVWPNW